MKVRRAEGVCVRRQQVHARVKGCSAGLTLHQRPADLAWCRSHGLDTWWCVGCKKSIGCTGCSTGWYPVAPKPGTPFASYVRAVMVGEAGSRACT